MGPKGNLTLRQLLLNTSWTIPVVVKASTSSGLSPSYPPKSIAKIAAASAFGMTASIPLR